jgi:tetratricopeptide (TPR) repeat protein
MSLPVLSLAMLVALTGAAPASASGPSPFVEGLKTLHAHYHEDPTRLDVVRQGLLEAAQADPRLEHLLALAQVSFVWGDVRAATRDQKLEAYQQGREAAQRAVAFHPGSALAHFWFATNSGRLGQVQGVVRSLFGLPAVKQAIRTAMELDPMLTATYVLAGYVAFEVPAIFGGDIDMAEELFRKGLMQDPNFTGIRVALAKVLIRKGRITEARAELEAVLGEQHPSNPADWTFKDAKEARELLQSLRAKS